MSCLINGTRMLCRLLSIGMAVHRTGKSAGEAIVGTLNDDPVITKTHRVGTSILSMWANGAFLAAEIQGLPVGTVVRILMPATDMAVGYSKCIKEDIEYQFTWGEIIQLIGIALQAEGATEVDEIALAFGRLCHNAREYKRDAEITKELFLIMDMCRHQGIQLCLQSIVDTAQMKCIEEMEEIPVFCQSQPIFKKYVCPITNKPIRRLFKVDGHEIYYDYNALKLWARKHGSRLEPTKVPNEWPASFPVVDFILYGNFDWVKQKEINAALEKNLEFARSTQRIAKYFLGRYLKQNVERKENVTLCR